MSNRFTPLNRRTSSVQSVRRSSQRDILPTSVQSRNLDNFIFSSSVVQASLTLGNGDDIKIGLSLTQTREYEVFARTYIALYIGSITVDNELPGGSSVTESQWQIIGPKPDYQAWADNNYSVSKEYDHIYIRNISAGSVTVYIVAKTRYISPREN